MMKLSKWDYLKREIKFRVWDKKQNVMMLSDEDATYLDGAYAGTVDMVNDLINVCEPEFIWQQYIGLKDKSGKEIYDGDIVKGSWIDSDEEKEQSFIVNGSYPFYAPRGAGSGTLYFTEMLSENFEIIGNIYENKELLEE